MGEAVARIFRTGSRYFFCDFRRAAGREAAGLWIERGMSKLAAESLVSALC